ncbi:MAG TPA: C-type lectin domain-containing protein [Polyangiales bacterium]
MRAGLPCAGHRLGLCALLLLSAACGRIGLQLGHATGGAGAGDAGKDAGHLHDAQVSMHDAGSTQPARDASRPMAKPDAGHEHDARQDASVVPHDAATAPGVLGASCQDPSQCGSGHCVASICCEFDCSLPPVCRKALGASCTDGHACSYAIDATASCSDGDPCTTDSCAGGSCVGTPINCSDSDSCTTDYCSAGQCNHVGHCSPNAACKYVRYGKHGYWMCPGPSSWNGAETSCQSVGLHLVSIDDQAEHDALWAQASATDTWIGYSDAALEGSWRWVDADPSTYTDWNIGAPSTSTASNCALMLASAGGSWSDAACSAQHAFTCERPSKPPPDPLCSYAVHAGHGYWLCETPEYWDEAHYHCSSMNLELASIEDAAENTFLQSQLVSASYYIGYSDAAVQGTFVWIDASPTSFTAWGAGEPVNTTGNEDYAVIAKSDGTWSAMSNAQRPYICEDANP